MCCEPQFCYTSSTFAFVPQDVHEVRGMISFRVLHLRDKYKPVMLWPEPFFFPYTSDPAAQSHPLHTNTHAEYLTRLLEIVLSKSHMLKQTTCSHKHT
jgi:hypothetical protein